MIKSKHNTCTECGREDMPWFSKKRCRWCASKSYSRPKKILKPKENKECLDNMFVEAIDYYNSKPFSEHSGESISDIKRLNIAHLFPKRKYKSVACLLENVCLLTWKEHTEFDMLIDTNKIEEIEKKFPNIWIRIKKVLYLVQEHGKLRLAIEEYIEL